MDAVVGQGKHIYRVDANWAKEHHSLWLEQEQARTGPGQMQRQPTAAAAAE